MVNNISTFNPQPDQMKKLLLLVLLVSFGCTRNEDKNFIVTKIRSAAKLATTEVVLNKIVIGNNVEGDRFLSFIAGHTANTIIFNTEATVKFGIRLDQIRNQDVYLKNDSIHIVLPPVEIINFSYPHEKFVELYPLSDFDNINQIKDGETIRDFDKVFRLAEIDIRNKIELMGLKERAETNTIVFLERFLMKAGYNSIAIDFKEKRREETDD